MTSEPSPSPEILDAAATAEFLRLDVRHVQRLASQGRLPGRRVGRKWLFFRNDLEELLRGSGEESPKNPPEAPPDLPDLPGLPGLSELPGTPGSRPSLGELSARNCLHGQVRSIRVEGLMAEVVLYVGGQEIVAVITRASVERLALRVGDLAAAVMKSTEVMIAKG